MLFRQEVLRDFILALLNAGNSMAARIAIIAITTRSSIRVKQILFIVVFLLLLAFFIVCIIVCYIPELLVVYYIKDKEPFQALTQKSSFLIVAKTVIGQPSTGINGTYGTDGTDGTYGTNGTNGTYGTGLLENRVASVASVASVPVEG